jgi:hypothetical protein
LPITAKTYLQLVNDAIDEAGVELEALTSSTFTTSTNPMHLAFKKYVRRAWQKFQLMRPWDFMSDQASVGIRPTVRFKQDSGDTTALENGDSIAGVTSDASIQISGPPTVLDSGTAFSTNDADFIAEFDASENLSPFFQTGEQVGLVDLGTGQTFGTAVVLSLSYVDLTSYGNLIDHSSFLLQEYDSVERPGQSQLSFISFEEYENLAEDGFSGKPKYITKDREGIYRLYPAASEQYLLTFAYTREPQELTLHSDTLTGIPSEYQDAVIWLAVMNYADQDNKSRRYMTAKKEFGTLFNMMCQRHAPAPSFGASRYNGR